MTGHSIKDIAAALGCKGLGAADLRRDGRGRTRDGGREDLALAMSDRYAADLAQGAARAAVLGPGMDWQALGLRGRDHRAATRATPWRTSRRRWIPGPASRRAYIPPP
jgi:hypothetical protein